MFTENLRYIIPVAIFLMLAIPVAHADEIDSADIDVPPEWGDTYTPEELAAIQRALWAANMTPEDLNFRKDYAEGYECFPAVRDWLEHPMNIAPGMDRMIGEIGIFEEMVTPSPYSELFMCGAMYPQFSDYDPELGEPALHRALGLVEIPEMLEENPPRDQESLEGFLAILAGIDLPMNFPADELELLRHYIPQQIAWHDVFESPYSEDQIEAWDEMLESQPDDYLYKLMSGTDIAKNMFCLWKVCPDPRDWLTDVPLDAFPAITPVIIETEKGRIGIGTLFDDIWEGDFTILIEPGGDDRYINCRIGAAYGTENSRYGYFVDLEGDDVYDCGDVNITLGAAILGVAAFYDLGQGNDRYTAGSCSLGAAMCGVATFYDDGGSDIYEGKVFTQGAAGFGIGVMVDESVQPAPDVPTDEETPDPIDIGAFDNDRYYAWANSQAFARTLGVAICSNERGNEIYEAGGVYLHAPLFSDRYQSFSQGFAIGQRGIDYAGGIALIVDYDGNDRYLGDVYNQGVGYWYSAGLLYDGGGNDTYEMTQYGQGSGIHLAVGGLIDVDGNDSYTMHAGLGTGGSHDYAASVLHDRGGNDQYFGNTSCNGGSLTNSAVIFIDREGNDTYAGRRNSGINFGRPARGFTSIGVFVDLSGEDDYLGIMDNGMLWSHTNVGVGWDIIPPPPPEIEDESEGTSTSEEEPEIELPEIISYDGELTEEIFDELWEISIRWEVGDNRHIVPHARDRIIEFGAEVFPYLSEEFDSTASSLALRAFNYILGEMIEVDRDGVLEILRENLANDENIRKRVALSIISTLKTSELEDMIAEILDDPDPGMQRRAIGALGDIDSHSADDRLLTNLCAIDDEALVKVSMETLFKLDVYCWDGIRPLLDHPYISVRETLIGQLKSHAEKYEADLCDELFWVTGLSYYGYAPPPISIRMLRSILKVFRSAKIAPDSRLITAISILLEHDDWGVRADAVQVVYRWRDMADDEMARGGDPSYAMDLIFLIEPLIGQVEKMHDTESDPYVLFVLDED